MSKTFSPIAKARITDRIVELLGDGTIGGVERLAGVSRQTDDALKLWTNAADKVRAQHGNGADCDAKLLFAEAMGECRRRIAATQTQWVAL